MSEEIETVKILWFSRHELTPEQYAELERIYEKIHVTQVDKTIENVSEIMDEIEKADVIAIVAPIPLQKQFLDVAGARSVICAKTKRDIKPDGKTAFVFDGWQQIEKIDIVYSNLQYSR